jgi:hypothetical protein
VVDYAVSDRGNVQSIERTVSWGAGVRHLAARMLTLKRNPSGYAQVDFWRQGRRETRLVHIAVLEAFAGPCPEGFECRHLNGVPSDNRWPENIAWGTKVANYADAVRHGTASRGERCGTSKLTALDVIRVLTRLAGGETGRSIAHSYGVTPAAISAIRRGKNWKHLASREAYYARAREVLGA